jgi:L-fucose mutarotase/ribose pyranase (RbsD/FucU family)
MSPRFRAAALAFVSVTLALAAHDAKPDNSWKEVVARRLPLFGHRNWIVIADSAYPSQSRPGIETVSTGADQLEVVEAVMRLLAEQKHVRPNVHLDAELPHVEERDARGIARYRARLKALVGRREIVSLPHEEIINKLDAAAAKFNVLILKTNLTLPYTSVFLELDCGYWSAEAEKRLREAMKRPPEKE